MKSIEMLCAQVTEDIAFFVVGASNSNAILHLGASCAVQRRHKILCYMKCVCGGEVTNNDTKTPRGSDKHLLKAETKTPLRLGSGIQQAVSRDTIPSF